MRNVFFCELHYYTRAANSVHESVYTVQFWKHFSLYTFETSRCYLNTCYTLLFPFTWILFFFFITYHVNWKCALPICISLVLFYEYFFNQGKCFVSAFHISLIFWIKQQKVEEHSRRHTCSHLYSLLITISRDARRRTVVLSSVTFNTLFRTLYTALMRCKHFKYAANIYANTEHFLAGGWRVFAPRGIKRRRDYLPKPS